MAVMIPRKPGVDTKSGAERELFKLFSAMEGTAGWTILHSVGIAKHPDQSMGEADFVVIIPKKGCFVLEVKGGIISDDIESGKWYSTRKDGTATFEIAHPQKEADGAMRGFMSYIETHPCNGIRQLEKKLFAVGVIFPDTDWHNVVTVPELADEQVADRSDCLTPATLKAYIERLAKFSRSRIPKSIKAPDETDAQGIASILRPRFTTRNTLAAELKIANNTTVKLTENQLDVFEGLTDNKRCLVCGSAGTGKTILAVNYANRVSVKDDKKVGCFCFNKQLGRMLRDMTLDSYVKVADSFTEFMLCVIKGAGYTLPENADNKFYRDTLPTLFVDVWTERGGNRFDCIVLDEAQDLMSDEYLFALDAILEGGLRDGNWYFFMDAERQNLFCSDVTYEDATEKLNGFCEHYTRFRLRLNCRNTRNIVAKVDDVFGSETRCRDDADPGPDVKITAYHGTKDQLNKIKESVDYLLSQGMKKKDIVILSPRRLENCIAQELDGDYAVTQNYEERDKKLFFSTIPAFKGLESEAVIICDFKRYDHDNNKNQLYVGMTRARSVLHVYLTEGVYKQIF